MLRKELVYLYVLDKFFSRKTSRFTQSGIAGELKLSLSTVNNALQPLARMGAVEVRPRGFVLRDPEKALVYWATIRDVERDVIYATSYPEKPERIEASMPSEVLFTGYSGYRLLEKNAPADYSEVYVYSSDLAEIKKRFPEREGPKNVFVLKSDEALSKFGKNNAVPLPLLFVDLWNLPEWYAHDFLKDLKKKLMP